MFWFKKSPTVKESIVLQHKNGEKVTVTVEGSNAYQVDYMATRIRKLFEFSKRVDEFPDASFEQVFKDMNKVFDDAEKIMKETFKKG